MKREGGETRNIVLTTFAMHTREINVEGLVRFFLKINGLLWPHPSFSTAANYSPESHLKLIKH